MVEGIGIRRKDKRMKLLEQEELHVDSGIPRFGCYFMSLLAIPQLVYQIEFSVAKILVILDACRQTRWWDWNNRPHHIVDYGPTDQYPFGKTFDCYLWDPGKVLDKACQWIAPQVHGCQVRNQDGWYDWAGTDKRFWSFLVMQIQRPRGFHYVLHDAARQLVYNPLPRIDGPYTGKWQGFVIGEDG
jgi:hypothetical protein